ncbi:dihydrofolate synthase / folylpolyglutamate synthase [Marinococcus luteus]|uniref:tetrahydrofolate synthase n=1 Tax=Marinococcus luteus TaxID=1122204 RepID=A0A1H2VJ25_9BACI|nr:folylpolyglutamate synthase/dihydrofolate synthase family protein [Marinococcus luteus]SDW67944.1 dihydrofolate synthase / folylpolyglutamate synthase [Marinococcus luteus]
MHTYKEAEAWVHSLETFGIRPGLDRMNMMLEAVGNPERRLKGIHIGGTNGKGSTTAFTRNIMTEAGIVCGSFTSPYIHHFRERIATDGEPISEEDFLELAAVLRPVVESIARTPFGSPTEFEVITVIAAMYFARKTFPDVVIWEVGLGGRLDATNAIHPMVSIITNIGHDHQGILGDTLEEVAREKAGIIKGGVPVVTCEQNEELAGIFEEAADYQRSKFYQLGNQFHVRRLEPSESGTRFSFYSLLGDMEDLEVSMLGEHQVENAAAAVITTRYLKMYYALPAEDEHIRAGLKKAVWPGRLEKAPGEEHVLFDGAHNEEGMKSLKEALAKHYPNGHFHFIVGMKTDKLQAPVLDQLDGLEVKSITAVPFDFPEAAAPEDIAEANTADVQKAASWQEAWEKANTARDQEDVIVFAGSLYFISQLTQEWSQ